MIYGLSQNPDTKDYIIVLDDRYCKKCGEIYTGKVYRWCKQCQIDSLKQDFTNWTSGNEKIDHYIQQIQSEINNSRDLIFEWIPYNQFNNIEEEGKNNN